MASGAVTRCTGCLGHRSRCPPPEGPLNKAWFWAGPWSEFCSHINSISPQRNNNSKSMHISGSQSSEQFNNVPRRQDQRHSRASSPHSPARHPPSAPAPSLGTTSCTLHPYLQPQRSLPFKDIGLNFTVCGKTLERALHKINSQSKALEKQNKSLHMKVERFLSVCFQADVLSINEVI